MEGSESSDHHRCSLIIDRDRSHHRNARTAVMHRESDGLRSADLHQRKSRNRDRTATMQLDLPLTCRHVEGSESSDHRRGSRVIDRDRGLHQDAGTIVIFIEQMASQFVGTVRSPSDGRQKGRLIM